jgi:hypothetical protein
MNLTESDLRSLCINVFSRLGAVRQESRTVYQVTTSEKTYYVGICQNLNISWESIVELGLQDVCLISEEREGEAHVWTSSELIDFYVQNMYLNETRSRRKPLV